MILYILVDAVSGSKNIKIYRHKRTLGREIINIKLLINFLFDKKVVYLLPEIIVKARGPKVPSLFEVKGMISETNIKALAEQKIGGTNLFLVDVKVKPANKIEVFIDAPNHVTVDDCVSISKHIEAGLDRDKEDFELTVSSPGIDQPFKVLDQYQKYTGKEVSTLKKDGIKIIGKLIGADENEIQIETKRTERSEKGKGKQIIIENITIQLNQIKETKLILPF